MHVSFMGCVIIHTVVGDRALVQIANFHHDGARAPHRRHTSREREIRAEPITMGSAFSAEPPPPPPPPPFLQTAALVAGFYLLITVLHILIPGPTVEG